MTSYRNLWESCQINEVRLNMATFYIISTSPWQLPPHTHHSWDLSKKQIMKHYMQTGIVVDQLYLVLQSSLGAFFANDYPLWMANLKPPFCPWIQPQNNGDIAYGLHYLQLNTTNTATAATHLPLSITGLVCMNYVNTTLSYIFMHSFTWLAGYI